MGGCQWEGVDGLGAQLRELAQLQANKTRPQAQFPVPKSSDMGQDSERIIQNGKKGQTYQPWRSSPNPFFFLKKKETILYVIVVHIPIFGASCLCGRIFHLKILSIIPNFAQTTINLEF